MSALTQSLLADLDDHHHGKRRRVVAERLLAMDGEQAQLVLNELAAGDTYCQHLAVCGALARRNVDIILSLLDTGSVSVSNAAARAAVIAVEDAARLAELVTEMAPMSQRRLCEQVLRYGRADVAAAAVGKLVGDGHVAVAAQLLPLCSMGVVASVIGGSPPTIDLSFVRWKPLARKHPDLVRQVMGQHLTTVAPSGRRTIWRLMRQAVGVLARTRPGEILTLVEELDDGGPLPPAITEVLDWLARAHPARTVALFTADSRRNDLARSGVPRSLLRVARELDEGLLVSLCRPLQTSPVHLERLLSRLAPAARGRVFELATEEMDTQRVTWPVSLLEVLPWAIRHRETRRILELRAVREHEEQRLAYASLLPFPEAAEQLAEALRASKAEDRARAYGLLLAAARRQREPATEALAHLARIKNDQDPVRLTAAHALSEMPGHQISEEDVPLLEEFVTACMEARDTSWATRSRLNVVARKLLVAHAETPDGPVFLCGLNILKRLAGQAGTIDFPALDQNLPRGVEHRIVDVLLPWLKDASAREYHHNVLRLAAALGKRAWKLRSLQVLVEKAIWDRKNSYLSTMAARLWLADPETRCERVRQLLDRDMSAIVLPGVFHYVHHVRQDWLDPYLENKPLRGRFVSGKTVWIAPATDDFGRWLPRQQRKFQRLLGSVANEDSRNAWERSFTVRRIARLPISTVDDLLPYIESTDVVIAEAGLGGLIWLDRPIPGLPVLTRYLDDDRARVAMYAIPRLARMLRADHLATELGAILERTRLKVTVHKEVLRLLGQYPSKRGLALLAEQWARDDLHKDVRIAAVHAARQLLHLEQAWTLIEQAACSPHVYAASALVEWSLAGVPLQYRLRYLEVCVMLARHPDMRAREALFAALSPHRDWLPGFERNVADLAADAVTDLGNNTRTWRSAALVLATCARDASAAPTVARAIDELIASTVGEIDKDLNRGRDLPRRQRLATVVGLLRSRPIEERRAAASLLSRVGTKLEATGDPGLLDASLQLALAHLEADSPELVETVVALSQRASTGHRQLDVLATWLSGVVSQCAPPPDAEHATVVFDSLEARLEGPARRLAMAWLGATGPRIYWSGPLAERLHALRHDDDPGTCALARSTYTTTE